MLFLTSADLHNWHFDCTFVSAMKKLFTIFLALTYLAISSGIVVNMHYCMGKLANVTYNTQSDSHCGICGMDDSGCCHDDVKVVKLEDNHKSASTIHFQLPATEPLAAHHSLYDLTVQDIVPLKLLYNNPPPDLYQPSFSILHSVFRI